MKIAQRTPWLELASGAAVVAIATVVSLTVLGQKEITDAVMVYLLGVVIVSLRFGYAPSLAAAVLSVLAFDFFFIPPYFTLRIAGLGHVATFSVMFFVAVVTSRLTQRVRDQAEAARRRELRTAALYAMSRELAGAKTLAQVVDAGTKQVREVFGSALVHVRSENRGARELLELPVDWPQGGAERAALESALARGIPAGVGTHTLPSATALYLPLTASRGTVGVLAVVPREEGALSDPERQRHVRAFADQIAAAIDRGQLAEEAHQARLQIEAEQLRNSVLSSVSHDLRTPLAIVTGAASTLLEDRVDPAVRRELTDTILQEADRLNRLVQNLLDMSRLEAGAVRAAKQWQPLEEVVGAALNRMEKVLVGRELSVDLPSEAVLVPLDSVLVEQVLVNLLENAAKYTVSGTPIDVRARVLGSECEIEVADRGPGVPEGKETMVFEKFYRAESDRGGAGLGLTICRGIVLAHGGRIWALPREGGGSSFRFTLPIDGDPPTLEQRESFSGAAPSADLANVKS